MGDLIVQAAKDKSAKMHFTKHLLSDIKCLELMLEKKQIESGINRVGAEQEFCLVSKQWRPEKNAEIILDELQDSHFTTELAKFNLEANLDPVVLAGDCFEQIEKQLRSLIEKAKEVAAKHNSRILLTGILPTISKTELSMEFMTARPRYWALNEMVKGMKGSDFQLHIKGVDELSTTHDSILMEACNTSFQMHLQVDPEDFVDSYNWAQAISGPVLGVCANSPLLLGRELWNETRIALFQQSIDTRNSAYALKDQSSRVNFGLDWEYGTAADIFKNEIANHKIILAADIEHDSLKDLQAGKVPKLQALNIHNGTIYRWNRPCYGATKDAAHLRIENRYIPAGPTIIDEIANLAFWVGLMKGRSNNYGDVTTKMDFHDAKSNFIKAARTGIQSVMKWNDRLISVKDLMTRELLPLAYDGLASAGIYKASAERLLKIIEERTHKQTGAQWIISNYRKLKKITRKDDALLALTRQIHKNQVAGLPVHQWEDISPKAYTHPDAMQVSHIMSTKLFTVSPEDPAELAIELMKWKNIHHIPVEGEHGEICGILTHRHINRFAELSEKGEDLTVEEIMQKDVFLAHTEMPITEAIEIMKANEIGCLPVVHNQYLIGIVTIKDIQQYDANQSA